MSDHTFSLFETQDIVENKKRWKTKRSRIYKRLLDRLMDHLLELQRTESLRNGPLLAGYERSTLYAHIDTYVDRTQVRIDAVHFNGSDGSGPGGGSPNTRFLASFALARRGKVVCLTQTGGEKIYEPNPGYTNTLSKIGARVRRMSGRSNGADTDAADSPTKPINRKNADPIESADTTGNSLNIIALVTTRLFSCGNTALRLRDSMTLRYSSRNLINYLTTHFVDFGLLPDLREQSHLTLVRIRKIRPPLREHEAMQLANHQNHCTCREYASPWHATGQPDARRSGVHFERFAGRSSKSRLQ